MQMQTRIHGETQIETRKSAGGFKQALRRVIGALIERDRRYREAGKLRRMSDERLADMGITRAQANNGCRDARR